MLDNLRQQASSSPFLEDDISPLEEQVVAPAPRRRSSAPLLGINPVQRFILSMMLLLVVCLLGMMFLLVTEKIMPPFLY